MRKKFGMNRSLVGVDRFKTTRSSMLVGMGKNSIVPLGKHIAPEYLRGGDECWEVGKGEKENADKWTG